MPDRREDGPEPEGVEPEAIDEDPRQRRQEHDAGRDQTGDDEQSARRLMTSHPASRSA